MTPDAALEYLRRTLAPYLEATHVSWPERAPRRHENRTALLVSPHPDDESINGALALRLRREAGWTIYNHAFSFGSNPDRRPERKRELDAALAILGFRDAGDRPIPELLASLRPSVVIFPHGQDVHPTHLRAHRVVEDALVATGYSGYVARWEFWHPSARPNLLLEVHPEDCATLLAATAAHVGEVLRNPYHLRMPFWMVENTRRGSERVLGNAQSTTGYLLSTLYEWARYENGREVETPQGRAVSAAEFTLISDLR